MKSESTHPDPRVTPHKFIEWWEHKSDWGNSTPFLEFDGGEGRKGIIYTREGICMRCGDMAQILCMDASEQEYKEGRLCSDCCRLAFET
jgi:hypothetical protein